MNENYSKFKYSILIFKNTLDKIVNIISIIIMSLLIIIVSLQVISRYIFRSPFIWTEELSRYLFVWLVFLSTSIVYRENQHLCVDFLVKLLPRKIRRIIEMLTGVIISVFIIIIIFVSPKIIQVTFQQISPTLSIPIGMVYTSFPVGMSLILLELIFRLILKDITKVQKGV